MPKFSASFQDGQFAGEMLRIERTFINSKVNDVIRQAESAVFDSESDKAFITKLTEHLKLRKNEIHLFSFNNTQVSTRANLLDNLLKSIQENNISHQIKLLEEKNIRSFKGVFSQRLYDILVNRRTQLDQIRVINEFQKNNSSTNC